jgi:radical SAM superfamily enzyme YgiQ (UPF0313 family)
LKVLLVSTNQHRQPMPVIPYGACLVAQAIEAAGHEVHFLDLMFQAEPVKILCDSLSKIKPEIVGLSIRNIDNNDMLFPKGFIQELQPLMDSIRRQSSARVILGGAALSILPVHILRATGADFAVTGDGDLVFPEFLAALAEGRNPSHIPGVMSLAESGTGHTSARSFIKNRALAPDFRKWIDLKAYASRFSPVPVKTQWGCPFECVYCTYPITEGRDYRLAQVNHVVESIKALADSGVTDIEFVDNVFNSPYDHAMAICHALAAARLGSKVRFHTVELNPAFLDDALLCAMEAAGFRGIGITAESAVDKVLEGLGKNYRARDVEMAAHHINRHSIPCFWVFLLGGPGESRHTVLDTLEFARKEIRPSDPVFFTVGLRIYPGTPLEALARKEGSLTRAAEEMLEPVFYLSPHLDLAWLNTTLDRVASRHFNFITPSDFAQPVLDQVFRLAYWAGLKPPIWKHTRLIRRGLQLLGAK